MRFVGSGKELVDEYKSTTESLDLYTKDTSSSKTTCTNCRSPVLEFVVLVAEISQTCWTLKGFHQLHMFQRSGIELGMLIHSVFTAELMDTLHPPVSI